MKIIIDAMGGDNAPAAPVEGALSAIREAGLNCVLVGREDDIRAALAEQGVKELPEQLSIVNASEIITMADNPATAFKEKKDSSMTVGLNLLKNGEGDAFVSAGSTGALLSAATLLVKRIRGIRRAALAPLIPNKKGQMVVLDSGANAECTPEYLLQFAFMGSFYVRKYLGVEQPRVGLLNIGAEEEKGLDLQRETNQLLKQAHAEGRINFIGNIEAREALTEGVDVLVCDGYSGNIFLKALEGTALLLMSMLKKTLSKNLKTKLAAAMVMGDIREMKKGFDAGEVGGTPLLGISKPVIKAHGSSDGYAIFHAITQAAQVAESNIAADIAANIESMSLPVKKQAEA